MWATGRMIIPATPRPHEAFLTSNSRVQVYKTQSQTKPPTLTQRITTAVACAQGRQIPLSAISFAPAFGLRNGEWAVARGCRGGKVWKGSGGQWRTLGIGRLDEKWWEGLVLPLRAPPLAVQILNGRNVRVNVAERAGGGGGGGGEGSSDNTNRNAFRQYSDYLEYEEVERGIKEKRHDPVTSIPHCTPPS